MYFGFKAKFRVLSKVHFRQSIYHFEALEVKKSNASNGV